MTEITLPSPIRNGCEANGLRHETREPWSRGFAGPLVPAEAGPTGRVSLLPADAGAAETFLPARDDVAVVDVVRDAAFQCSDHRAGCPGDPLLQLAAFGVGRRVGREDDLVRAQLAQRRIHTKR